MTDPNPREQHLAEELAATRATLARYRRLFALQPDMIVETDSAGLITFVSPSYCDLLGVESGDLLGQPHHPEVHDDDRAVTEATLLGLATPPHTCRLEHRIMTRHGWRWLSWSYTALPDDHGQAAAVVAVGHDITVLKQTQLELDRQTRLFNAMLDNLPIGVFMIAAEDGRPLLANPMARELLGRDVLPDARLDSLATTYRAFRAGCDQPYPQDEMPIARGLQGVATHIDDMEVERPDGTRRRLEVFGVPVNGSDGRIWASLVGFVDITERCRAAEEQARFHQQLEQAQKLESLGVLAGGIAHDFNNILMAIHGHCELAYEKVSPLSPARDNLTSITTAARRAAELCRQMLAYAGKATFANEIIDIYDLIDETAHLLRASISKKALLNLHCERGLPPIQADPSQIRQILLNLIINASDAIGDRSGVISISVGATRCDADYLRRTELTGDLPPGLYVHIEVSDTGSGMDAETRARLFEPFFTTKFTGRGLGLAAVMGIVKSHQGALKVYSEPDKGTTFKLLFPALTTDRHQAMPSHRPGGWRGTATVLLVDDEESLRALGAEMLEELGCSVLLAEDGLQAVERYRKESADIDLVILDLTMPHMDGAEAFSALRHIDPELPIVLSSGYTQEDVAARFAGKALSGVLPKPFSIATLATVLAEALPHRNGDDGASQPS